MLSVGRRLAAEGLAPGTTRQWAVFDPATMKNAPVNIAIGAREVVDRRHAPADSRIQGRHDVQRHDDDGVGHRYR